VVRGTVRADEIATGSYTETAEGVYYYKLTLTDKAGNVTEKTSAAIYLDHSNPVISGHANTKTEWTNTARVLREALTVNGSLNIFNHHTNVDVDNRFTVFAFRDMGEKLAPPCMLIMMETIQKKIIENGEMGFAMWLYIDEFHTLLNPEYTAKYLQQLWKKVRKQGGLWYGSQ
jgi:hypothetical protein